MQHLLPLSHEAKIHLPHYFLGSFPVADPGFGEGGAPEMFPENCRWRAMLVSEQTLAGVQGPP